ncbi:hypothetical protein OROGR_007753 [Orobanche gracilis]
MDSSSKINGAFTPAKEKTIRSKLNEPVRHSENINPNVSSTDLKLSNSPSIVKSTKKSASKNPSLNQVASPSPRKKKIRERKFVIAKKKSRNEGFGGTSVVCEKCKKATGKFKCPCVAYESLRASQEDFFKNRSSEVEDEFFDQIKVFDMVDEKKDAKSEIDKGGCKVAMERNIVLSEIYSQNRKNVDEAAVVNGDMGVKRSRDRLLEEAREALEVSGSGRVMNLVKEFEKLTMSKLRNAGEKEAEEVKEDKNRAKWELRGQQKPPNASETQVSSSSFCPSEFFLTSESLGLDSRRSYSLDSAHGSISTKTSAAGRKFRRSSIESSGNHHRRLWKRKQAKATSQKPFMLRTEERGRCKEEEFMKKLRKMIEEEEKMRIPIAQGLPWTTDEPECLVKPPVRETTRPLDLVLHSDVRAVDRSEFDHQVSVKISLIEQYRMERERQQKLEEEEDIRRLRKELVPKAQPMPYFDRPFIPGSNIGAGYFRIWDK